MYLIKPTMCLSLSHTRVYSIFLLTVSHIHTTINKHASIRTQSTILLLNAINNYKYNKKKE